MQAVAYDHTFNTFTCKHEHINLIVRIKNVMSRIEPWIFGLTVVCTNGRVVVAAALRGM